MKPMKILHSRLFALSLRCQILNIYHYERQIRDRYKLGHHSHLHYCVVSYLPTRFNDVCDKLYNEISSFNPQMNDGDMDFFHSIRMRRKSIYTDHPLPPQTNPLGIRGNTNRL